MMPKIKIGCEALAMIFVFIVPLVLVTEPLQVAAQTIPLYIVSSTGKYQPQYECGSAGGAVDTSIDFGCTGNQCIKSPSSTYCKSYHSATMDLLFAIVRFISDGVGLIIIASLILAGIQYTFSRGEPQAIAGATKRVRSSVTALVLFIFAYALLNYIIPTGLFGQ